MLILVRCRQGMRARTKPRRNERLAKRTRMERARRIPLRPASGLTKKVRGTKQGHHHETRVLGRPRRQLLSPGPRPRCRARTKDRKDFRNGRQPVHAAEHTALRAATL